MDNAADIVRNGYDECWHTGFWQPADVVVVGCDGVEKMESMETTTRETPISRIETLDRAVLDAETYFAFDKAELKPGAVDKLNTLLESIRDSQGVEQIFVTGHADRIGPEAYNEHCHNVVPRQWKLTSEIVSEVPRR